MPRDLAARWRTRLGTAARGAQQHPLARRAYDSLTGLEIALATAWAGRHAVAPCDDGRLTLVVKAFERPALVARLLGSVRRVFAGPIIVADDSRVPFTSHDPGVKVLALPFDTGVGPGRNALIDAVTTEYLWMADDDMVVLPDLDVGAVVAYLDRNPDVDLCGGRVVNLPLFRSADYSRTPLFAYRGEPRRPRGSMVDGLPVYEKVPNFYVARTESVRRVRYDDQLKRVDHRDFFTAAFGRLLCVHDATLVCLHSPSYFDSAYQAFRMDFQADLAYLARKWGAAEPAGGGVRLSDTVASGFHRQALEVVAGDLGLSVQVDPRAGRTVTALVRTVDRSRFESALRSLGWSVRRSRLSHPLWGDVVVEGVTQAELESAAGEAAGPVEPGWVRWSPRAATQEDGDALLAAPMPQGPVIELRPPGDVIWDLIGPAGVIEAELGTMVRDLFPDAPDDLATQVQAYLDTLVARGLVERGRWPGHPRSTA